VAPESSTLELWAWTSVRAISPKRDSISFHDWDRELEVFNAPCDTESVAKSIKATDIRAAITLSMFHLLITC
jgi:hypothetical protein